MKFLVRRTSCLYSKPCDEAVLEPFIYVDERTVDDPAKIPAFNGKSEWWYKDGTNHRVIDGHICRDINSNGWFIEVSSLDELMQFYQKYGRLIFLPECRGVDGIEIYDDYR